MKAFLPAALLVAGLALPGTGSASPLSAFPAAAPLAGPGAGIIQVYGGCGPYGHRGPYGGCRPGGQLGGGYAPRAVCPPGWHPGPYGRRCFRN